MTDEKMEYSAGPHSDWANGSHLTIRIRETKYRGVIRFRVFFGSDRKPMRRDPYETDIDWRLYVSREAVPKAILDLNKTLISEEDLFFVLRGIDLYYSFEDIVRAVGTYARITNEIRQKLGFPIRSIPKSWRHAP